MCHLSIHDHGTALRLRPPSLTETIIVARVPPGERLYGVTVEEHGQPQVIRADQHVVRWPLRQTAPRLRKRPSLPQNRAQHRNPGRQRSK